MNNRLNWLLGAGLGAVAMYYLDPSRGRYRRALVRNQLVHASHKADRAASVVARDVSNRTSGVLARLRSVFDFSQPDDEVLSATRTFPPRPRREASIRRRGVHERRRGDPVRADPR